MHTAQLVQNPFALLLDPAAVLAEVERSGRLNRLASRICRPLDKPVVGAAPEEKESPQDAWIEPERPQDNSDIIR